MDDSAGGTPPVGSFGDWLRRQRRMMGMTQAELATRASCATITVRKIEAGERRPSETVARCLGVALGTEPSQIASLVRAATGWRAPTGSVPTASLPGALPAPRTTLIGRDEARDQIVGTLKPAGGPARLVTLIGPPGVGKTRLAIAVAARAAEKLDLDVIWADLTGVPVGGDVAAEICAVVLAGAGGQSPKDLASALRVRGPHLLVVDNFEHLLVSAPQVGALLDSCPSLTCLVTSRVRLDVYGEHEVHVPPLDYSAPTAPALALFSARAGEIRPDLDLFAHTEQVMEVCRRLDGLPLAIELAALRLRDRDLPELIASLAAGEGTMGHNRGDSAARHGSARAATRWSYELLEPRAQRVLAVAGVFSGPFTASELASLIPSDGGGAMDVITVAEEIAHLADHALVERLHGEAFRMLVVVREFARAELADQDRLDVVLAAHAALIVELVEAVSPGISSWPERAAIDAMERREADVLAALAHAFGPVGDVAVGVRLVEASLYYLHLRGRVNEVEAWALRALRADPASYRNAYHAAMGRWGAGRPDEEARVLLERSLAGARAAGDAEFIAECLVSLQLLAVTNKDYARAEALSEQCWDAALVAGPEWLALCHLRAVKLALHRGDPAEARRRADAASTVYAAIGSTWGLATASAAMAGVLMAEGRPVEACARYLDSMEGFATLDADLLAAGKLASASTALAEAGLVESAAVALGILDGWTRELGVTDHPGIQVAARPGRRLAQAALQSRYDKAHATGLRRPRTAASLRALTRGV